MKAISVKELQYLRRGTGSRLIVAAKYLSDGRVVFIDRKNSVLLITNTSNETTQEVDLVEPLFGQNIDAKQSDTDKTGLNEGQAAGFYKENAQDIKMNTGLTKMESASMVAHAPSSMSGIPVPIKKGSSEDIKPSDVNSGFDDDQLLISYTGKDFSLGVIYKTTYTQQRPILQHVLTVKVMDRTRSIVVLDKDLLCATTQNQIVILNKSGDVVALHRRSKRDRGGLLMSDGEGRFFYGDGDEYVGCQWDGRNITEIFRFTNPRMRFPRGSAIDRFGSVIVSCDTSHNIFRISRDGMQSEIIMHTAKKSFGDIDTDPDGQYFVTTFWQENEWPILYKVEV